MPQLVNPYLDGHHTVVAQLLGFNRVGFATTYRRQPALVALVFVFIEEQEFGRVKRDSRMLTNPLERL
jgi:hypothetical protein